MRHFWEVCKIDSDCPAMQNNTCKGFLRVGLDLPSTSGSASGDFLCDQALQNLSGLYGLPVDINLDGKVDGTDLALIASKFGSNL